MRCHYIIIAQRNESIMGNKFSIHNLDTLDARREQYLYMKEKFPQLSGKAQSQLLENCLYLGQKHSERQRILFQEKH